MGSEWSKETPLPSISTPRLAALYSSMRSRPSCRWTGATGSRNSSLTTTETLKHLAREGMGENSLRALASDLAYLETWADAVIGQPL
jgi:hypothetical protein